MDMDTTTTQTTTFPTISTGDRIEVKTAKYGTRVLTVMETNGSDRIYTTSGRVRPGHFSGGVVRRYDNGKVFFQPTMQQQCDRVLSIAVVGVAH